MFYEPTTEKQEDKDLYTNYYNMKEINEIIKNNDMLKEIILAFSKWDWKLSAEIENWEIVSFNWKICK